MVEKKPDSTLSTSTKGIVERLSLEKADDIDRHNAAVVAAYGELLTFSQALLIERPKADEVFFQQVCAIFERSVGFIASFTDLALSLLAQSALMKDTRMQEALESLKNNLLASAIHQYMIENKSHQWSNPAAVSDAMHQIYRALEQAIDKARCLFSSTLFASKDETGRRLQVTTDILVTYLTLLRLTQQKIENYHFAYHRSQQRS